MANGTIAGRIGIRREDKDITEKRAPLTPIHVKELVEKHRIDVLVRPSKNRVYTEQEYADAGACITEDLSSCNIIFGVKEIPTDIFLEDHTYCFFSHTIKGQFYNMGMLKTILALGCTLIDYEKVTDTQNRRLIHFGEHAGYAGMIDSLWAYGQRLLWEGLDTPFAQIKQANNYRSLEEATNAVRHTGLAIRGKGLPPEICPLVCGFTGSGHVSKGAQQIYDLLDPQTVAPERLAQLFRSGRNDTRILYKTTFGKQHRFLLKGSTRPFDTRLSLANPGEYESCFETYVPILAILINGIYWEPGQPRLITKRFLQKAYTGKEQLRLRVIGDITNDIGGSIECNLRATTSLNPVYVYNPITGETTDGWEGIGPVVLAVDKLPSEIPKEASMSFGNALMRYVPALAHTDFNVPFEALKMPDEWLGAVIVHRGRLTKDYLYLEKFLDKEHS